jgi:hypothetical protein
MLMARGRAKGRLPGVRSLALVIVLASIAALSCEEAAQEPLDASIDQSAPTCTSDKDCMGGLSCSYETLVGCGDIGECRDFTGSADAGCAGAAMTLCGCDGKNVDVPACWMGFSPAPVQMGSSQPCGDAH